MKHELYRLRPVMSGHRCIGHTLQTSKGFKAFNAADKLVGEYSEIERAADQLRRLAGLVST